MTESRVVGDVATVVDCEHRTAPRADADAYGFSIGTRDVRNGRISLEQAKPVSRETFESWTRRAVPRSGDLIFSREAPMGEVGAVPTDANVCLGQRTVLLQPDGRQVDHRFLRYSLMSPAPQAWISANSAGSTVLHLNVADVRRIPIRYLPDLVEQQRIVDILEDHLSRLDAAEADLERSLTMTRALVRARLWRATHTGSRTVPLAEIAEVKLGRQRSPKNHHGDQMVHYLRAANVDWNRLRLDSVKSMNFTDAEQATFRLHAGDILLTEASGSPSEVGKSTIYKGDPEEVCFQNTLLRVRAHGAAPEFIQKYLLAEAMAGRFMAHARGVGIHHLGRARLAAWPIEVPESGKQFTAIREAENSLAQSNQLRIGIADARMRSGVLRRALLAAAFSGQLTGRASDFDRVEELAAT